VVILIRVRDIKKTIYESFRDHFKSSTKVGDFFLEYRQNALTGTMLVMNKQHYVCESIRDHN
jgi:hypothetical protein